MEWKDLILELVNAVKSTSFVVWTTTIKQVIVQGIQLGIWSLISATCSIIAWVSATNYHKKNKVDPDLFIFVQILTFGLTFITVVLLTTMLGRFINPEYYAIAILIKLATGN
jgi:hypothetical protein